MGTEKGYLIIADISGYTEFTVKSEIEHAEGVMQGLIGTILDAMEPPFAVAKLEGDAVFAHILHDSFYQHQSILETVENIYFRFRDLLFQMQKNTVCPCGACVNMKALDLKFVVHYGEYIVSQIGGGTELSGSDVIAVHRLLKNSVVEKTGYDAYCFITKAAMIAMGRQDPISGMIHHAETVDQIGTIGGYVYSLNKAWQNHREQNVVRVDPASAYLVVSETIPLPQAATWDFMHDDKNWIVWSMTTGEPDFKKPASGRNGIGLEKHCVHGKENIAHTIVDWRPFDYYSTDLLINGQVNCRHTITLQPVEGGTQVSFISQAPTSEKFIPKFIIKLMGKKLRQKIEADFCSCLSALKRMVEDDLALSKKAHDA